MPQPIHLNRGPLRWCPSPMPCNSLCVAVTPLFVQGNIPTRKPKCIFNHFQRQTRLCNQQFKRWRLKEEKAIKTKPNTVQPFRWNSSPLGLMWIRVQERTMMVSPDDKEEERKQSKQGQIQSNSPLEFISSHALPKMNSRREGTMSAKTWRQRRGEKNNQGETPA